MTRRTIALITAAIVVAGGLAVAQTTTEGMDHSKMGHSGMKMDMEDMGNMDHTMLIPPEFAEDPATLAMPRR